MGAYSFNKSFLPKWLKKTLKILFYPLIILKRNIIYWKALNNPRKTTDRKYFRTFGCHINYENPESLNEKIHWLKFYSDTSKWPILADKYRVREYLIDKGFDSILNELYSVYESIDAIDISNLPNSFVMKMNNGSGDALIVEDKTKFTNKEIQNYFKKIFRIKYGFKNGEYYYWLMKPYVIAEKYLVDKNTSQSLTDYKFYCFNGRVEYVLVCYKRSKEGVTLDTYDKYWNHLNNVGVKISQYKLGDGSVKKPVSFNRMIEICMKLSEGIPFIRIDLYEINETPIFGEMTLTPAGGFITYYTKDFLNKLGENVELF